MLSITDKFKTFKQNLSMITTDDFDDNNDCSVFQNHATSLFNNCQCIVMNFKSNNYYPVEMLGMITETFSICNTK